MNMAGISVLARSVLLLCILQWTRGHRVGQEPVVYSRFDYESKLLERMVMVEHRMNLLQESNDKELDTLRKEKQTLEETVLRLKQQLKEEQANKIEQLEQLSQSLTTNVSSQLAALTELDLKASTEQTNKFNQLSHLLTTNVSSQLTALKELDLKASTEQANKFNQLSQLLTTNVSSQLSGMSTVLADALTKLDLKANVTIQDIYDKTVKPAVVFHVKDPSNKSPGSGVILKFSSALTNTDNVYNTGTGYFTAPIPGVYMFAVQICGNKNKYINFRLYVNNVYITDTTEYDGDSSYHCTSTNAAAVLEKGDTVCVKTGPTTSAGSSSIISESYRWSTFTGALLY